MNKKKVSDPKRVVPSCTKDNMELLSPPNYSYKAYQPASQKSANKAARNKHLLLSNLWKLTYVLELLGNVEIEI